MVKLVGSTNFNKGKFVERVPSVRTRVCVGWGNEECGTEYKCGVLAMVTFNSHYDLVIEISCVITLIL